MKAATCMAFTLFKPTSYLQYHPQYKKPVTTFPAILDGLLPRLTLVWLYLVSLTMGDDGGGGRARLCFKYKLGRCKGKISLFMGH